MNLHARNIEPDLGPLLDMTDDLPDKDASGNSKTEPRLEGDSRKKPGLAFGPMDRIGQEGALPAKQPSRRAARAGVIRICHTDGMGRLLARRRYRDGLWYSRRCDRRLHPRLAHGRGMERLCQAARRRDRTSLKPSLSEPAPAVGLRWRRGATTGNDQAASRPAAK